EKEFLPYLRNSHPEILKSIRDTGQLTEETINALKAALEEFKKTFTGGKQ
ncbi:MAG TPA: hypothetical protein GX504_02435, partial [Clostridia bacterium]|nr:hypothetical protein [Clostridia bacterium]